MHAEKNWANTSHTKNSTKSDKTLQPPNNHQTTKTPDKLQCYLALKREFTLANYLSTINTPKLRKVLTIYRLSEQMGWHRQSCCQKMRESAPSVTEDRLRWSYTLFTPCPKYQHLRVRLFPIISNTYPEFESKRQRKSHIYLDKCPAV